MKWYKASESDVLESLREAEKRYSYLLMVRRATNSK